ncbi:ESPR-type extended signal peptide-containing protein [Veillonella sp. CHU594]|uniref:ESPR-type extended signal peptide-containing protein n=1 Tax=Veillonella sp. CHU594 TaxID=2490948 RepID=UPI000F8F549B|nr:ESPR-type extended signal peptide-containing protein [Veillonella sp. CHU594]
MALNRIYKVVWSKTKGCYVVVSELAKRVGRNKAKAIVISSAAMAMAVSPVITNTVGAAINNAGTGSDTSVAFGGTSSASGNNAVAVGTESQATQNNAVAVGRKSKAIGDSATAIGLDAQASGNLSEAIGVAAKASGEKAVAISANSNAQGDRSLAIGQNSNTNGADAIALGTNSKSTNLYTVAFGRNTQAAGQRSMAFGNEAKATANDTIAFGSSSEAKKNNDIIIGKEAQSRAEGNGHSIAIGYNSTAGSDKAGAATDVTSTGKNTAAGGVAIGVSSYTGVNRNNTAINSSVAIGAGAGAGFRAINTDGIPTGNGTDPDDNATVLAKAFGNTSTEAGNKDAANRFNYKGVDINEGTAVGRNTRAIGDQAVALGAQSIAGQGAIAIGGNDITQFANTRYFMSNRDNFGVGDVSDHDQSGTLASKNISQKYQELVGAALNTAYQATYAQNGSTVIGMQAHSTTPLGVAIGTNALVRKGAYGATAIGSGSAIQANAEAAVAIGMGSWVNGKFGVAAGTASRAEQSAVATGYKADAGVSAVSVGDESKAVASSVAVGQLAKAEKTADIAVGQGAVASGEQGAIAMGLGTQAQGDSSIMIGGSEITEVAAQKVNYQKEKIDANGKTVIKSTKKTETIGGEQVERTIRSVEMENTMGTIQQAYGELTNGDILNTTRLDYSSATNRNGHGSISMGIHSLSTGDLGTAIGTGARVTKLGGVALGTGAISELQNGVAIGTGSRADSRSIGTRQTDISYDEEGHIVPFDSKKVAYTFYWAGGSNTSEGDVVSFGSPGAERQLKNVAAGRIADDSTDAINGSQLNSVTKRMSNGWSVEAEKDKTSSGVLKLNGALATKGTEVHSANGKTTTRENPGTATGNVDKIRLNDEVKIRVGDNLVLHQEDASRPVYEDPDDPTRQTGTRVTSKFTYSLNPELTGLKSAQFKNDAGDTTDINGAGVTVTPVTAGKQPVSLTTAGLNNGGNAISNVAGNLPSTKNNDATTGASNATTSQAAPTLGNAANQVNPTNAATVSDVLNAGWNLQGNNKAVDFVKPYDTVNFVNGDGTTATVESTDGKISTVKYSVNLGDGLKKDDATNKITVSAADKSLTVGADGVKVNPGDKSLKTTNAGLTVNTADKSLEVTNDGLKVKTDGTTITTDDTNGLKVNTGVIESVTTGTDSGTVKVKDGDKGKIATVDSVVNAVNSAAWIATSAKTTAGELGAEAKDQAVKAGDKVTFEADKNIKITQAGSKFTFATKDNVSFDTVQVGGSEGPKFAKAADGSIKVSDKDGTEPVKITNVKDGDISADSKDAINGSQFHKLANNTIQLKGQTGDNAATETNKQELNKENGIAFTVKSSDGTLLEVSAADDTITLKPKTATLTTGTDGVPTANTTGGKLVTADQLVNTLKSMGWKATAGQDDKGTVTDATVELIKAGETVTFKAGNNLAVKQVGKNFIYSLQKDLTDLTSAGFKNAAGDTTAINGDGVTITPVTNGKQPVSLTKDGLNNGGNPITNVGGNLDGAKAGTNAPTTSATAPTLGTGTDQVNKNNAATVGDVLNAGWNLQNNDAAKDFVKPYDTVNFVDGEGTTAVVETTTDQVTSKIKYNVNTGKGLEKTADNKITVKPGDKSLEVTDAGVAVKKADQSLEVTDDGLKVKTDNKTITTGKDGLTVNTGTVNAVEQGDKKGTVEVPTADAGKIATVDTVAKAVNNAAFTLKASANGGTRNAGSGVTTDGESIKAGSTIEMIAGKNLDVKHDASGKITFATVENPSFNTIQVGGDQGPKLSKTDDGNIKVSDKDGTNPVNITNVKSNLPDTQNSDAPNTATNPSNATKSQAAPTLGTSANQVNPANAATVGDVLNAGWNLQGNGSAVDFVKPYDTVNFVNGVNTTAVVSTVDGKTSNVTYNVTGLPITYTDKDGNPVSKIGDNFYKVNDKGQPLDAKGNPSTKVNKDGKPVDDAGNVIDPINTTNNPVKTSLVNPAPEANKTGTTSPTTLDNVTSKLENYKADPVNGKEPAKNSLRDLTNTNVTDNTVATVGDIRNMGWIVSSDKTTGANGTTTATEYSEAVKNANEVRFVGEGSAIVSGKTDDKGVRTITVKVDSQTGLNKTVTPVNYTKADGTKVYPQEVDNGDGTKTVKFFENPDGTGKEIPKSDVVTSVNGPEGTKNPTTLKNVKNNIPNVNDGSKTITTPDGTETAGDVENINKAPLTAAQAAELANPKTKDGQTNPKYIGNNAATVSDVLNAGWNLQNNGAAKDFVKPYDTVNFINGLNTTAVVTTSDDGTTSNVTYNVTGLPVTYTTEDGTPVTKIGDKYYKVNDQGQPLDSTGAPVTKFNKDGKPLDANGQEVPDVNITDNPLKTSLVNPTPEANKTGTTSPTSLSNVKNNIPTVNDEDKTAHKADGTAIDGKNNTEAPITAGDAANLLKPTVNGVANPNFVGNNAATVSDVLNAGWNLQNNGTAKDFVKPYDTVNFVNGGNTTAVVTTNAAGTASDVTFNVTGLPVTYTTEDGAPVSKVGDKYYKVNDKGQPISDAGKPAVGKNNDGKLVDENNNVIEPIDTTKPLKTALVNPTPAGDKPNTTTATQLGNVTSGLDKYGDTVDGKEVPGSTKANNGLVDLSKPANGDAPKVSDNTAATVGDLRNMGWIVSSNKTTGENGAVTTDEYSATVKNANEVKFVGEGTAVVSGKTDDKGVRTITVKVDDQTSTNNAVTPVVYTDKDGKQVYPTGKVGPDGNQIFNTKPDGKGEDVTGPVKTTINGPKGTNSPTSLNNVKNNIPNVNDGSKTITDADGNEKPDAGNVANINKAPLTATEAAELSNPKTKDGQPNPKYIGNNAATVSDVLNAGWNLQNNGTAKDFVKPYDTVNFVNGLNTTAVVTTSDDGTTSNVTYNVTGLPVTYTTADGTPVSKIGDKFYKVNDKGQPVDEQGNPSTKVNNNGEPIDGNGKVINPIDTAAKPLKTSLVNPAPETNKTGTTSPTTLDNVTSKLTNYSDPEVNGKAPVRNNLVDLSKPEQGEPNVSDNTVATVGDLRNMGWIVSSDKTTGELTKDYSDTVKNANEVKFVGEGTAIVSGKTDDKGVRTITVKVDDQTSTNNAVTPVVYTDKDGKQVYPTGKTDKDGNQIFNTKPDGKGEDVTGPVKTTINGPKGTASPTSLSNVKNNIPAVNDADKKVTNADGTDKPDAGNVANINKAPLTAEEAADLLKPTTKDGKSNPNFVGNNAATVSDVLNAGWNLQNNGAAKDFVKPFDTVNFVNGVNTTAVVTTSEDGTTSNVTYNVTGLPVTYTTADGTPVSKIGDKYYKVNEQGQPLDSNGKPATKINENGVPVGEDGQPISEVNITDTPLTSKLVNPNAKNTDAEPNKKTTDPTQLGNVTSGLQKYGDTVDGKEVPGSTKANNGLVDLSTPTDGAKPKVSDNTAATVGDLRNMGWIVSSDKTTGETDKTYTDTVKNANEVKFVGEGTAIVSGKTDGNVRTITVKVDDQTSTNNSVTPVNYTKADGTKVYPKTVTDPKTGKEEVKFFENPDGSGAEVPKGDVVTSINGPEGTTSPTTLKNVKNNIPNVNDGSKTITNPDGTEKTGDVENINKAPLTAEEAAALANPKTKDGQTNPKYIGNNAATVSDVLNAGWNLQNNGAARDFVKPFDTVNFVNGVNTTAVVTTSEDGTTSNVTYNVTGLPVTYTTADGTPVSKIGDDYYTVNDKGQPIDANGKPSTKVNKDGKPVDENGNVIKPIDTTANPLTSSLVNPNVKNTDTEPNKKTTDPTQLGNVTSGLQKYGDTVDGKEVPGSTKANNGLVDLSTPTDGSKPKVSDNTAATVGDLRNMGWIVSSDKTTGETDKAYTDTVKNANEVKFVGEGTAIVSGKTDDKGVRTITVKVDDQTSTNNSVTPVNYTKADGTKVYPKAVRDPKTGKEEVKFFENPDGSGAEVPKGDVVTSINGPEGTTSPTTLKNVKNNIPNVNDGSKTITNPDGTEKTGDVENINKAPLTAEEAAELANPKTKDGQANPKYIGNNAATVSDVLNAGWNLQNNGESRDFVKPYDTVNFVNGLGTTAVVTTREDNTASDVTFNVKAANGSVTVDENGVKVTTGEMKPAVGTDNKETGAIATPADPATAKQLKETLAAAEKDLSAAREALKEAEKALAADPKDPALQQAVADKKADVAAKQTPVDAAQKAHDEAGLNKVATVQNVAEAINNAGFNLKTSADRGEKLTGTKDDGELIKPSNTVEMVAGNNLTVKQDANGKITYATKDNVTFTNVDTGTLNVGSPNTYTDGKGNTYTKVGDKYYKPADVVNGAPKPDAIPVDVTTTPVTPVSPVTMKAEAAKPATNNASDAQPSSALNVTSKDGKPTQITGVGSTLNTKSVDTTPKGTAPSTTPGTTPNTTPVNLVDLEGTADAPVNKNAAATVGDLQNMGWVVSAKDGNGYKDVVKNANVVDFKGGTGIEITGKTLTDGTREITVGIKEGEVTNKVTITHADGSKTDAIKIGDNYYKVGKDGKPEGYEKGKDGKPAGTPLTVDPKNDKVTNTGAGFVTGNTVANAIQESGWNVGIGSTDKDYSKDAKVYDKVNPNDDVKFANGANTNVSMVTVDAINEDGTKKATTFVKVDVNRDLKIDSVTTGGTAVDKNGNNLVKVGDDYYKESDIDPVTKQPKANAKPVPKADVTPAKDGAMIVKNADGKDVVSATVGKDGNGEFAVKGKDGKDGISMRAKDGQGTIGVNGKDGATTTIKGDTITIKDKEGNTNTSTPTSNELKDTKGNTNISTADKVELTDKEGNTNTSTPTTNVLKDINGNTNTSTGAGTTYKDKDDNTAVVGPKEIALTDKSGDNKASFTNKDLIFNAKDPKTGVEKTSHVSGDKIAFTTTDEMEKVFDKDGKPVIDPTTGKQKEVVKMEKVFDKDGKPVIDPTTGKQKEVIKNPGNSTEYTNEGLKVIPNSTVARDANGNLTYVDKDNKPVMKDKDGNFVYMGKDGKPGEKYAGAVGALKPNVVDNTRVISFGMDKPVLDEKGNPVTGPDGNPLMTEGISAGMQQMHNLAPGTKDTDAVNVSQLRGTTININNRINRSGAQAAALAGLQTIQYDPLEPTQVSAGLGYYQGASALALGVNHYKNESTLFHVGASFNGYGSEVMANASVTWKFGARADETAVKDTFRQGPISASYTLQDKVSALEAQNQIQKDQLNELRATNAAQKAENEAQREELALVKAQVAELYKLLKG